MREIKKIDCWNLGIVSGFFGAIMSLVVLITGTILNIIYKYPLGNIGSYILGLILIIIVSTISYFILGIIVAFIYNTFTKFYSGVKIEIEEPKKEPGPKKKKK